MQNDSVTFAGQLLPANAAQRQCYLLKLSPQGNVLWARQGWSYIGIGPSGLCIAANGNIVMAGNYAQLARFGSLQVFNPWHGGFVLQYDAQGNEVWLTSTQRIGQLNDLALDPAGNSYIAGYFSDSTKIGDFTLHSAGDDDAFVAKLGANGAVLWAREIGGHGLDHGWGVISDTDGYTVAVAAGGDVTFGNGWNVSHNMPYGAIVKYTSQGQVQWVQTQTLNQGEAFSPVALAAMPGGGQVVLGIFYQKAAFGGTVLQTQGEYDIALAKLGTVLGHDEELAGRLKLYPNPAGSTLTIELPPGGKPEVRRLQLLDLQGREVFAAPLTDALTTTLHLPALPAGMYLVRVSSSEGVATAKLTLY